MITQGMSATIRPEPQRLLDTWLRYYNGPNAGMIDVELARREVPWLVGESVSITIKSSIEAENGPSK